MADSILRFLQSGNIPSIDMGQIFAQQSPVNGGNLPPDISAALAGQQPDFSQIDPKTLSGRIQDTYGAGEPNQSGSIEGILASRFKPDLNDWADSVAQTATTGAPISPSTFADARMQTAIKALETMQQAEFERQKFSETQRHNMATEGLNAQRINASMYGPGGQRKLSHTEQKELFDLQDTMAAGQNVIGSLDHAIQINDSALSGAGAGMRRDIGRNVPEWLGKALPWVPGDKETINATTDLETTVTEQALNNLKAIFGGMPTEGERKILLEMQGSLNKSPAERKIIFERAKSLANNRLQQNQGRASQILSGNYTAGVPVTTAGIEDINSAIDNQPQDPMSGWTIEEQ